MSFVVKYFQSYRKPLNPLFKVPMPGPRLREGDVAPNGTAQNTQRQKIVDVCATSA